MAVTVAYRALRVTVVPADGFGLPRQDRLTTPQPKPQRIGTAMRLAQLRSRTEAFERVELIRLDAEEGEHGKLS